ncbi:MAG: glycosyltransferase family 4 protein [Actinobacteria bacterium]|nr:glycosyltransferase family 4 protein [Actinomycetota bacterium]
MILNLCPYWVYPPTGGGPLRVYNLNKYISDKIPINQFSFRPTYIMKKRGMNILSSNVVKIKESYTEYRLSNPLVLLSSFLLYKLSLPPDFLLSRFSNLLRNKALYDSLVAADIIQVEHPWLFDFAEKKAKDSLLVLSSHNCEFVLFKKYINRRSINRLVENALWELEKRSVENADVVFVVSEDDLKSFREVLNVKRKRNVFIIPNGVDSNKLKKVSKDERKQAKKQLGFYDKKVILFTGSIHPPNLEAVKIIEERIARDFRTNDIVFLVVGSVGEKFKTHDNIIFTGYVEDIEPYIKAADLAINPVITGSGTNLKMLEYMAYGLPVVTTKVGARGLGIKNKEQAVIADIPDFSYWIRELLDNEELYLKLSNNARQFVEERYDWRIIANKVVEIYKNFL